jgi:hypothetical protein
MLFNIASEIFLKKYNRIPELAVEERFEIFQRTRKEEEDISGKSCKQYVQRD